MDRDKASMGRFDYDGYAGEPQGGRRWTSSSGQKLDSDDEQFATVLAHRIKLDLKSELDQGKNSGTRERVMLAISSVWAAAAVFGLLVLALILGVSGNNTIALGCGAVGVCIAIIVVNGSFNWAAIEMRKAQSKQENPPEQKQKS